MHYAISMAVPNTFKNLLNAVTTREVEETDPLVNVEAKSFFTHLHVSMDNIVVMAKRTTFQHLLNTVTRKEKQKQAKLSRTVTSGNEKETEATRK